MSGSPFAWNTLGLFDMVVAVALGVASSPGGPISFATSSADSNVMTALPWILIQCFNVPLLVHLHLLLFQRLRRREPTIAPVSA